MLEVLLPPESPQDCLGPWSPAQIDYPSSRKPALIFWAGPPLLCPQLASRGPRPPESAVGSHRHADL